MEDIKASLQEATIAAMRLKDQRRLKTLRLINAAIKQKEIDSRTENKEGLSQQDMLYVLDKMLKQCRDSHTQYQAAGRQDLAEQEAYDISVLEEFMPQALSEEELNGLIHEAIKTSSASSEKDLGKVIGILKPKVQGRADMKALSEKIKILLSQ